MTHTRLAIIIIIAAIVMALSASVLVGNGAQAAPLTTIADKVVSYWTLDEINGTRADIVGDNPLSPNNIPNAMGGIVGNSVELDSASTEYLRAAHSDSLTLNDSSYSLSVWFWVEGGSVGQLPILSKGTSGDDAEMLLWWSTGTLEYSIFNIGQTQATYNFVGGVSDATWHHVIVTYNETISETVLYLNGTPVFTDTVTGPPYVGIDPLDVGYVSFNGGRYFNGAIDEVAIFDEALSAEEVTVLYNGGFGCPYPFVACENVADAWQWGNYLVDGDMEIHPMFDDTWWGYWKNWKSQYSSYSIGSSSTLLRDASTITHQNDEPVCGTSYRRLTGLETPVSWDGSTLNNSAATTQRFFWYGGDAHISVAYRTQDDGAAVVNVHKLFSASLPQIFGIEKFGMQLMNTSAAITSPTWDIYTDTVSLETGWYELELLGRGEGSWSVDFDGASVSENGFYRCAPNTNINTLPDLPPMPAQRSIFSSPTVSVEALQQSELEIDVVDVDRIMNKTIRLYGNYVLATGGDTREVFPDWYTFNGRFGAYGWPSNTSSTGWATGQTGGPLFVDLPKGMATAYAATTTTSGLLSAWTTQNVWVLPSNPGSAITDLVKGWSLGGDKLTVAGQFVVDYLVSDKYNNVVKLENVYTGQVYDANTTIIADDVDVDWFRVTGTFDVPPGMYRVNFYDGGQTTLYITELCMSPITLGVNLCGADLLPPGEATMAVVQQEQTTIAELTGTPRAASTATAQMAYQRTATAVVFGTQGALVATNNPTQQALATQVQAQAQTATPRAAMTSTAFVLAFRGGMTQSVGLTQTAAPYYGFTSTAIMATRAYQTQQATIIPQSTRTAMAATQMGIQPALATQNAANRDAEIVSNANATATTLAIQVNYFNNDSTMKTQVWNANNGDPSQQATAYYYLTALPQQNSTLAAQATQLAQARENDNDTLRDTQAVTLPPAQPWRNTTAAPFDSSCARPDNAVNIPWWIEYSVCRIVAWFSWNNYNTQQLLYPQTLIQTREPFFTITQIGLMLRDLGMVLTAYDWTSGATCGQQEFDPGVLFQTAQGVLIGELTVDMAVAPLSTSCDSEAGVVVGPYVEQGMCLAINVLCILGLLPIFQLIVNAMWVGIGVFYFRKVWIEGATV